MDNEIKYPEGIPTPDELAERFSSMVNRVENDKWYDMESMHYDMDEEMLNVLEAFGYGKAVNIFRDADKWYA